MLFVIIISSRSPLGISRQVVFGAKKRRLCLTIVQRSVAWGVNLPPVSGLYWDLYRHPCTSEQISLYQFSSLHQDPPDSNCSEKCPDDSLTTAECMMITDSLSEVKQTKASLFHLFSHRIWWLQSCSDQSYTSMFTCSHSNHLLSVLKCECSWHLPCLCLRSYTVNFYILKTQWKAQECILEHDETWKSITGHHTHHTHLYRGAIKHNQSSYCNVL